MFLFVKFFCKILFANSLFFLRSSLFEPVFILFFKNVLQLIVLFVPFAYAHGINETDTNKPYYENEY